MLGNGSASVCLIRSTLMAPPGTVALRHHRHRPLRASIALRDMLRRLQICRRAGHHPRPVLRRAEMRRPRVVLLLLLLLLRSPEPVHRLLLMTRAILLGTTAARKARHHARSTDRALHGVPVIAGGHGGCQVREHRGRVARGRGGTAAVTADLFVVTLKLRLHALCTHRKQSMTHGNSPLRTGGKQQMRVVEIQVLHNG